LVKILAFCDVLVVAARRNERAVDKKSLADAVAGVRMLVTAILCARQNGYTVMRRTGTAFERWWVWQRSA